MQTLLLRSHPPASARGPLQPAEGPARPVGAVEKRTATRIPAGLVPRVTGVRLSPCGGTASLVNISTSGAAVKSDTRLLLETPVTLKLEGEISVPPIKGRVSRCGVASIEAGVVWYHIGIAFNEPISIEGPEVTPAAQPDPVPATPQAPAVRPHLSNRW